MRDFPAFWLVRRGLAPFGPWLTGLFLIPSVRRGGEKIEAQ
jgi:hypothetical protein